MSTIEEKAKAYDDALERAKRIKDGKGNWRFSDLSEIVPAVTEIFPVLAESEDERIMKQIEQAIIEHDWSATYKVSKDDCLAYLEKQKEQKPAEWSEEEKRKFNRIYQILGLAADAHAYSTTCRLIGDKEAIELQDFLRSIAKPGDRPAGWSEEDEEMCQNILECLRNGWRKLPTDILKYESWLKSLLSRPKTLNNWKPSDQ